MENLLPHTTQKKLKKKQHTNSLKTKNLQLLIDSNLFLRGFSAPAAKLFSLSNASIGEKIHSIEQLQVASLPVLIEKLVFNDFKNEQSFLLEGSLFNIQAIPFYLETEQVESFILNFVEITPQIAANKEFAQLNVKYDSLMFALSHDLRQPISTMTLLVDGLRMAFEKQNPEQFNRWMNTLKSTVEDMQGKLHDFTDDPQITEESEKNNLELICQETICALKDEIFNLGISIKTNFEVSELQFPKNNLRSLIYEIFYYLIKNNSSKNPEINISTKKTNDFVLLHFTSNGLGIPKDEQEEFFEKKKNSPDNSFYVMKRILINHGAKIELNSSGNSTEFKVFFGDLH